MGGKAMETEKIKGPHRPTFHTYDTFTKKDERERNFKKALQEAAKKRKQQDTFTLSQQYSDKNSEQDMEK